MAFEVIVSVPEGQPNYTVPSPISQVVSTGTVVNLSTLPGISFDMIASASAQLATDTGAGLIILNNLTTTAAVNTAFADDAAAETADSGWENPVLGQGLITPPVSPAAGNRQIVAGLGGAWSTATVGDIAEFDGTSWGFSTPSEGDKVYVDNENLFYQFTGVAWAVDTSGVTAAAVNAAGAVMETDYNANTVLAAVVDDTPTALALTANTTVARTAVGNVAVTALANVVSFGGGYQWYQSPIVTAQLTAAAVTQTLTLYGSPVDTIVYDAFLSLATEFGGGGATAVSVEVGRTGDDDGLVTSIDIWSGTPAGTGRKGHNPADKGADIIVDDDDGGGTTRLGSPAFFAGGTTITATVTSDVFVNLLTAGSMTIYFCVAIPSTVPVP